MDLDRIKQHIAHGEQGSVRDFSLALRGLIEQVGLLDPNLGNVTDPEAARHNLGLGALSVLNEVTAGVLDPADVVNISSRLGRFPSAAEIETRHIAPVLTSIWTDGYYVPGDGGGAQLIEATSSTAGAIQSADGRWWAPATVPGVNIRQYGARGDGTTDDTAAIQAALDSGAKRVLIPPGQFITKQLEATVDGQEIVADAAGWLVAATVERNMLIVDADDAVVRVNIDGQDLAEVGIRIEETAHNYRVSGCHVKNLRSEVRQSFGILLRSPFGGSVVNNRVSNLYSLGDGQSGNGNGMSRAIQYSPRDIPSGVTLIANNTLRNVFGEEGDVIAVQVTPPTWSGPHPYPNSMCVIVNNYAENWTRRFIKMQGSNALIRGNEADCRTESDGGLQQQGGISIIASDDCVVEGNIIRCYGIANGLNTSGSGTSHLNARNIFRNNTIVNPAGYAVQVRESTHTEVSDNTIIDDENASTAGLININGGSVDVTIKGNLFQGTSSLYLISAAASCARISVIGNESRMAAAKGFANLPCAHSLILQNTSHTAFEEGVFGGSDPGSDGSVCRFNTAIEPGSPMFVNFGEVDYQDLGNVVVP